MLALGYFSHILNKATLPHYVTSGCPFFPLSSLIPGTLFSEISVSVLRSVIDGLQSNIKIWRFFVVIS